MTYMSPPMARTRALAVAYEGNTEADGDLTTYSFTSEPIGDAHPNRAVLVFVVPNFPIADTGLSVSSLSVGGIAGTKLAAAGNLQTGDAGEGSSRSRVEAWVVDVSTLTGSTATISATMSAGCYKCNIYVYSITDGDYYSSDAGQDTSGAAPEGVALSLSTVVGGITVACGISLSSSTPTSSSSNLGTGTADVNSTALDFNVSGGTQDVRVRAASYRTATATSGTWDFELTGGSSYSAAVAVHFEPTKRR
jgi:hypothetical protein